MSATQGYEFTQLELPFGLSGLVNTIREPISVTNLGRVLIHEHLFCRVRPQYLDSAKSYLIDQLNLLARIHEVKTIVDLTTYVLPDVYLDLLSAHTINVICCAGYYLSETVPSTYLSKDVDFLADKLHTKFKLGIGRKKVKPGIIKVASRGRDLTDFEKRVLIAAARVQKECEVPIATHACRGGRKQLEMLIRAGANPNKVFLSHMEMELKGVNPLTYEKLVEDISWILKEGAYLFLGDFPSGDSSYRKKLLNLLHLCCEKGHINQLFISTDSHWRYRHGQIQVRGSSMDAKTPRTYEYTFSFIVPFLLKNGFSKQDIDTLLERNPALFFSKTSNYT